MIKSMTGYGKAVGQQGTKKFTVEIRSLNSKQMDLSVKLPSLYRQSEYNIRTLVSKGLTRGKVDVYVAVESEQVQSSAKINAPVFALYMNQLKQVCEEQNVAWDSSEVQSSAMASVLRMPDVVSSEAEDVSEQELKCLEQTVSAAIENIDDFRKQEGEILITDLLSRVDKIESLRQVSEPLAGDRCEMIKNRIREAVVNAGVKVDENRLEQEIVFYVEKLDVTEEQVRLKKHCEYFHEVSNEQQGVGRKLGFVAQEMGREINTLGSKANDVEIQRLVVQMKDELEKIKEQLLNIL